MTGTGCPGKRLCRGVGSAVNRETKTGGICLDRYLNWILSEGGRLRNGPAHRNRSWIGGSRIRTRTATSPAIEVITHLGVVGPQSGDHRGLTLDVHIILPSFPGVQAAHQGVGVQLGEREVED